MSLETSFHFQPFQLKEGILHENSEIEFVHCYIRVSHGRVFDDYHLLGRDAV
jgi:hypothetical protein